MANVTVDLQMARFFLAREAFVPLAVGWDEDYHDLASSVGEWLPVD